MTRRFAQTFLFCAICIMLLTASGSCKPKPDTIDPTNPGADWAQVSAPRPNVYMRATFDKDPRRLVGRMIQKGKGRDGLDEDMAVQSRCSKYVTTSEIEANQKFTEMFNASNDVEVGAGFNPLQIKALKGKTNIPDVEASVGNERGSNLVVEYTLTRKLVSEISDPEAFEACCDSDSRACSELYIGEFIAGTGSIYVKSGRATDVGAEGGVKGVNAKVKVYNGWAWEKSSSFEDSYFAFRVYDTYLADNDGWDREIPIRDDGQYFVGISPETATEDKARELAMRDARAQAIRFIGTNLTTSSSSAGDMFNGFSEDNQVITQSASGLARLLKGRKYKTERIETTQGWKWKVKVLAWFPQSSYQEAARVVADVAVSSGKLDSKTRTELLDAVDTPKP